MSTEIIVPRLGWSMEEGAFVAWLKQDGESVQPGDPLFSIEGDKAVQEIESIDSGVLRIAAHGPKPGDVIRVGDILGHLIPVGETLVREPIETGTSGREHETNRESISPVQGVPAPVTLANRATAGPSSARAISPRALRVAAELGVDWTAVTGTGRTGRIRERDIRAAASSSASKS